jgi:hypothetical protein
LVALRCHPATASHAVEGIEVRLHWPERQVVELSYVIRGNADAVALPAAAPRQFADRLWQHTCAEAFLSDGKGGYCELNFSPSTRWAAYRFSGYRKDMTPVELTRPPAIRTQVQPTCIEIAASVDLAGLALPQGTAALRLGLCAVIEETGGTLSYWALSHPGARPDFHHADAFTLTLPRPDLREGVR